RTCGVLCREARVRSAGTAQSRESNSDAGALRRIREDARPARRTGASRAAEVLRIMEATLLELQEQVLAARHGREPLRLRGAGTKDFYGERIAGTLLDLRSFSGIVDYEPSELVITVRCGTALSVVEKMLAECGQYLAFEPPGFGGDPTIGGAIAAGLSGPR